MCISSIELSRLSYSKEATDMSSIITLAHGSGGIKTGELINKVIRSIISFKKVSSGVGLDDLDDSAIIPLNGEMLLALTIDSYTVKPIFFPGGDIGKLAITGTINDLAVMGALPIAIVDSIVVEEGFSIDNLRRIVQSMNEVSVKEGVAIVGGDFKVMPKGNVDEIVITTAGIGLVRKNELVLDSGAKVGDKVIVTGTIGEHGATILAMQLELEATDFNLLSDCSPITKVIREVLSIGGLHAAKDPTRGGLATALNDIAKKSQVNIVIRERDIPISRGVRAICELTGIDPLHLACEGRAVMVVDGEVAETIINKLRNIGCSDASIIGEVTEEGEGLVFLKSVVGGTRIIDPPRGEVVPRIC